MILSLIVKLIALSVAYDFTVQSFDSPYTSSHIWLTVSARVHWKGIPYLSPVIQRELVINWRSISIDTDTWIGLFDRTLNGSKVQKVDAIFTLSKLDSIDGSYRTKVQFPVINFQSASRSACLGYTVALVKGDQVVEVNCLKSQPDWMKRIIDSIGSKQIKSLVIPGTHDTGSYSIGYEDGLVDSVRNAFILCQDESPYNQLIYGNRYLDIRVRYDEKKSEHFWIGHGDYPIKRTVRDVLTQVKDFMDSTEKEIVILDFHRFPVGFEVNGMVNVTRHYELLKLVESILGDHLADNSDGSAYEKTVDSLVSSGRRLILGHAEWQLLQNSYLFPNVRHVWPNTDSIDKLLSYFNNHLCYDYANSYSAMAQITPQASTFLTKGGLRQMADSVNPLVTKWFQVDQLLNRCANVIATDFFLGNNIIEIAIASNVNRR